MQHAERNERTADHCGGCIGIKRVQAPIAEFAAAWSNNHVRHLELPHANHLTVCDEMANPGSPLFDATLELVRRA
jgi:hypothetical protein